jgi:tetratricopeptide (TPR) repeat protein
LLCRTISVANQGNLGFSASLAVEDINGWAAKVTLYNFQGIQDAKPNELDTMFPVNTMIIIREPYVKMEFGTDSHHIEIQSPSDLVILQPGSPFLSDVEWKTGQKENPTSVRTGTQWKKLADRHVMAKEYFAAAVAYSNALQVEPSLVSARVNRSMTNFYIGAFAAAQRDVQVALKDEKLSTADRIKALCQSARAAYSQGDYESSMKSFLDCSTLEPTHREAKEGVQNCVRRLKEVRKGDYDWRTLFERARSGIIRLEVADYKGPLNITEMKTRGGGRGVVATREIKPGELLVSTLSNHFGQKPIFSKIVSKPFASAGREKPDTRSFRVFLPETDQVAEDADFQVFQNSVKKCALNPVSTEVYDLYDGKDQDLKTPRPPLTTFAIPDSPMHTVADVDVALIRRISIVNSFAFHSTVEMSLSDPMPGTTIPDYRLSGLYVLPSFLNHSCAPNVERTNFGDVMVLRTMKTVKEGEELTLTYAGHDAAYELRTKILAHYKIKCDCPLCAQDSASGSEVLEQRTQLLAQMKQPRTPMPRLLQLVRKLSDTYPTPYGSHKWDLYQGYKIVVTDYKNSPQNLFIPEQRKKVIEATFELLEALNIRVVDKGIDGQAWRLPIATDIVPYAGAQGISQCIEMVMMMLAGGNPDRARAWFKAATWSKQIYNSGTSLLLITV